MREAAHEAVVGVRHKQLLQKARGTRVQNAVAGSRGLLSEGAGVEHYVDASLRKTPAGEPSGPPQQAEPRRQPVKDIGQLGASRTPRNPHRYADPQELLKV